MEGGQQGCDLQGFLATPRGSSGDKGSLREHGGATSLSFWGFAPISGGQYFAHWP